MTTRNVLAHECDSPDCSTVRCQDGTGEDPVGFYGTVREVTDTGGTSYQHWYACHHDHIAKAIADVLARAWSD
jgi:hypothetical protein